MATHDRPPWYIDLWLGSMRAWGNVALELLAWPEAINEEGKMTNEQRVVHCWQDGPPDEEDYMGTTCMLLDGHEGDHEWMRDDQIRVTLPPAPPEEEQDA